VFNKETLEIEFKGEWDNKSDIKGWRCAGINQIEEKIKYNGLIFINNPIAIRESQELKYE